jgi:uncharacterized protein (TIGR00369 family)
MTAPESPASDFRARAKANDVPIARLIGFQAQHIAGGHALVTLAAGPQHANPMGTLHGGILCDIADAAMGMAFASTLAEGESFTTVELKINFFRPVWEAQLKAEAKSFVAVAKSAISNAKSPTNPHDWSPRRLPPAWFSAARTPKVADLQCRNKYLF